MITDAGPEEHRKEPLTMNAECTAHCSHCSHCCPYHGTASQEVCTGYWCVRFRANKDAKNWLGFGFLEKNAKGVVKDE